MKKINQTFILSKNKFQLIILIKVNHHRHQCQDFFELPIDKILQIKSFPHYLCQFI
jgi:phosphoribosylpyrophosphate synthetase